MSTLSMGAETHSVTPEGEGQRLPSDFLSAVINYIVTGKTGYLTEDDKDDDSDDGEDDDDSDDSDDDGTDNYGPTAERKQTVLSLMSTSRFFLEQVCMLRYAEFEVFPYMPYEDMKCGFEQLRLYQYVKSFSIHGDPYSQTVFRIPVDNRWMHNIIPFLERCDAMDHLHIQDMDWGLMDTSLRRALLVKLSQVQNVGLVSVRFRNSNQMARVLGSFLNHAESVTLIGLEFRVLNYASPELQVTAPLNVKALHVHTNVGDVSLSMHQRFFLGNCTAVKLFGFHCLEAELPSVIDLLRLLAPSLSHVQGVFHTQAKRPRTGTEEGEQITHATDAVVFDDDELDEDGNRCPIIQREPPLTLMEARALALPKLQEAVTSNLSRIEWTLPLPITCLTPVALRFLFQLVTPRLRDFELIFNLPDPPNLVSVDWQTLETLLTYVPFGAAAPHTDWCFRFKASGMPPVIASVAHLLPRFINVAYGNALFFYVGFDIQGVSREQLARYCVYKNE